MKANELLKMNSNLGYNSGVAHIWVGRGRAARASKPLPTHIKGHLLVEKKCIFLGIWAEKGTHSEGFFLKYKPIFLKFVDVQRKYAKFCFNLKERTHV